MTQTARTVETKFAEALPELLYNIGDTDNMPYWVTRLEDSFPSPIIDAEVLPWLAEGRPVVEVRFEDGSVLHLTVTQVKEANQ